MSYTADNKKQTKKYKTNKYKYAIIELKICDEKFTIQKKKLWKTLTGGSQDCAVFQNKLIQNMG